MGGAGGWLPGLSHISQIIKGLPQIGALVGAIIRLFTDAAQVGIRFNRVLETSQIAFMGVTGSTDKTYDHISE